MAELEIYNATVVNFTTYVTGDVVLTAIIMFGILFLLLSMFNLDITTKLGIMALISFAMFSSVLTDNILLTLTLSLAALIGFVIWKVLTRVI